MSERRFDPEAIHRRIATLLKNRKSFVVATILDVKGSAPQLSGARIIVHPTGPFEFTIGGGTFEAEVIQDARAVFSGESPQFRDYKLTKNELGMYCQGVVKVFFEKYVPRPQLLIFGGGHVGQALSRISGVSGLFSIAVIDDREEYANAKKHPTADSVRLTDRTFTRNVPAVDEETYVVIVTRCHATDKLLVKKYVDSSAAYIGLIGSGAKVRQFMRELSEEGVSPAQLERIHAPIGLPIGGKDPSEVAISILAEIVQVKNEKKLDMGITPVVHPGARSSQ